MLVQTLHSAQQHRHCSTAHSRTSYCCSRPAAFRQRFVTVCRYDRRRSASNVADRRQYVRGKPGRGLLDSEEFAEANETVVADRARMLRTCTQGKLNLELCLFIFTEQPQLLSVNTKQMAARIMTLADALGLPPADVAEVLIRCPALLDVLPLRLRSVIQSLSSALELTQSQALFMLASDLNLLDTPPLRVRQYAEALTQLFQVPLGLVCQMVWQCPHLLRVEAAALQVRWNSLQAVLSLSPTALQHLAAKEPRLLMPSSKTLTQNHADILQAFNIAPSTLKRWVFAAPMLLLVPAAQLQKRLAKLGSVLGQQAQELIAMAAAEDPTGLLAAAAAAEAGAELDPAIDAEPASTTTTSSSSDSSFDEDEDTSMSSSESSYTAGSSSSISLPWVSVAQDALQLLAYVSKDPRVLLLSPQEISQKLRRVTNELGLGRWMTAWLMMSHPSYVAVESGLVTSWMHDVRHLTDVTTLQAKRLAACPQVFLTMSPEDVMAALFSLDQTLNLPVHGQTLGYTPNSVAAIAAEEPLLLVQHPAATAAALRQLQGLIQDQALRQELMLLVPELLLQGQQLQQVMGRAASVLNISCAQLAVILMQDPGFWTILVPRHTWPCCPQWQQQEQQQQQDGSQPASAAAAAGDSVLSPAAATAAATMSALMSCGLRPPAFMQAAVVLHPALLRLNPDAALHLVETLSQRCSHSATWQHQLRQELTPDQLGKALTRAVTWDARLAFVIEAGWTGSIFLGELVQLTQQEFQVNFGADFCGWQAQRFKQQMQQRGVPALQQQQLLQRWYRQQQLMLQGRQQRQQQQQGQQLLPEDALDSLVQGMQAKAAAQSHAGFHIFADDVSADDTGQVSLVLQQHSVEGMQHAPDADGSDADVFYDDMPAAEDAGSDSDSTDFAGSSSGSSGSSWEATGHEQQVDLGHAAGRLQQKEHQQPWQEQQLEQQAGLSSLQGKAVLREQQTVSYPTAADPQRQQLPWLQQQPAGQKRPAGLRVQQVLQETRRGKYLPNSNMWSVSRREQMTAAAQLSGLELYGTWLGCLVQPAGAAAVTQGHGAGVAGGGSPAGVEPPAVVGCAADGRVVADVMAESGTAGEAA